MTNLSKIPFTELQEEIKLRLEENEKYINRRDELQDEMDKIETNLLELDVDDNRDNDKHQGRKRHRRQKIRIINNKLTLQEALAKILKNKELSLTEIVQELNNIGHKIGSENPKVVIGQIFTKNKDMFTRIKPGTYTLK